MFKNMIDVEEFFEKRSLVGIKPGLERMGELLNYLDHPEKRIDFLHVAGTNGKGSTIQYLKAGLQASGLDVGIFTSPSLTGILGHILINQEEIKEEEFLSIMNHLIPKIKEMDRLNNHPTEFEIITTIAFEYFAREVSIAIIEAGMGGALDTTNCVTPVMSLITNISIDHTEFLGGSIEEITREKAGIIKEGIPIITGETKEESLQLLKEKAQASHAKIVERKTNFYTNYIQLKKTYILYHLHYEEKVYRIKIRKSGNYQIFNSSLALIALIELNKKNIKLQIENVIEAFQHVTVAGRFERIHDHPEVFVDGAHNVAGIQSFIKTIKLQYKDGKNILVFSAFKDKKVDQMIRLLLPHFDEIILTSFNHPRAFSINEFKDFSKQAGLELEVKNYASLIKNIRDNKDMNRYFFTGSLHFVKAIKREFIE